MTAAPTHSWARDSERSRESHPHVRGFTLMRNYGQHNALLCGIRQAQHEIIVTMDDDLQHPPGEIHKLLDKLSEGYDVVYGTPQHEQHGLLRDLASQITKLGAAGQHGRRCRAQCQRLPRLSHAASRRLRHLQQCLRLD